MVQIARTTAVGVLLLLCAARPTYSAQAAPARSAVVQALYDCGKLVGDGAQLACYVETTNRLKEAEQSGKLVIIDHQAIREKRRADFGLRSFGIELRGDAKKDAEPLSGLNFEIEKAYRRGDGTMVFVTTSGAVWAQTENRELPDNPAKGSKLVVKRGTFGSYYCTPEKMFTVTCKRAQ